MGKKRQFIPKGEGQKFHLLHRSQTDSAYAEEENPSDFVLVPAQTIQRERRTADSNEQSINTEKRQNSLKDVNIRELLRGKDHIRPDGFKNDGYDYSKHLKEMGGGLFIGPDGKVHENVISYTNKIQLPSDLLPSNSELDRNLEAIVISEKYMDEDVRNALFDDADEDGVFEELDDDFVLQAMAEPETEDFDFDAHIARLIAASQRDLEYVPSKNQWRDESSEDDDVDEDSNDIISDSGRVDQAFIENQFEKTIEEYDDDEIGDLGQGEVLGGDIDIFEHNAAFEAALDEFINEQIELKKYDVPNSLKSQSQMESTPNIDEVTSRVQRIEIKDETPNMIENEQEYKNIIDILHDKSSLEIAMAEQQRKQNEAEETLYELSKEIAQQSVDDAWNSQEYLRQEKKHSEWDCETILSTYSTLDNHPSVIKDENSKYRPYKSRFVRSLEQEEDARRKQLAMIEDKLKNHAHTKTDQNVTSSSNKPSDRIVLSRKNQLPIGYYPTKREPVDDKTISDTQENSDCNSTASEDSRRNETLIRSKNETKEEKRLRKLLAKQQKKTKRLMKKEITTLFKTVENQQSKQFANQQDINHARVFKTIG